MLKRFIPLFVLSFLAVCSTNAQNYNFVKFGVREGVMHSLVTGITQDKRGDIWMATGGGLCRFNGVEFDYITTKNGLNFTRLTCVATDDDDNIWVGSSKGLNFIYGKTIYSVLNSLLNGEILAISSAGKSMAWVVSNSGLFKVKFLNGEFSVTKISIPLFQSAAQSQIFQDRVLSSYIFQNKAGSAYYINSGKLYCVKGEGVEKINSEENLFVNTGVELINSTLLFGTNKGICKLEGTNLVQYNDVNTSSIDIKSISSDGKKVWLLGKELIADKFETYLYSIDLSVRKNIRKIGKNNGLTDEPTQLFIDHEGNVWTTSNNGVSLLKGNAFVAFNTANGMAGNKTWGISKLNDGSLWVGTIGEGLTIINDNKFTNYSTKNGLPDNYIAKIFQAKNGEIYLGTGNAGICKASYNSNSKSHKFVRLPLLLGSKLRVDDILEDKMGMLWVASNKGLYYSKNYTNFIKVPLFQNDTGQVFVQKLQVDTLRNVMWIGTRNNGVFTMQNGKVLQFDLLDSKLEVSTLAMDNFGDIWIGTRTNGAFRYDGTNITRLTEKDGLASNLIYVLYPDKLHNLWVGTNLGLDWVDLKAFKNVGKAEIRHYGSDEGLVDLEINLNGVFEDGESGFWIATNGGLLKYERAADKPNSIPPKVRILNLKLNSQETNWREFSANVNPWNGLPEKLILKHYQNHLTFEFAGVSFRNPRMVKYAWKLEGFDKNWITSSSRQAIYSNIPPGNYTFKLKAANSDTAWSNDVESMLFIVRPPFWETWWFRISVVLVTVLLIYIYVINRIRSLREKQKELESLVGVRTLELREQFDIVDRKNKQILDSLMYAKFLQNAILTSIDEIKENFSDAFVYYKPKDIVSGDFYWYTRQNDLSVFAVADCTGHGVPGAIISVICENALRQAVTSCGFENPAKILEQTNNYVVNTFTHTQKDIHPGMEIALCTFNHKTYELKYSGAKLGMYIVLNGEFVKFKPSVYRIGWNLSTPTYSNQVQQLLKGDILYLFTDGYGDQFEPIAKKKFSSSRLKKILFDNHQLPSSELYEILEKELEAWQAGYDQIDDVLVVGIKV